MTIQGKMALIYERQKFEVSVKTILKKGVYYFFISDQEEGPSLLDGQTAELVFRDGIVTTHEDSGANALIPPGKITALADMLLVNKKLWDYSAN